MRETTCATCGGAPKSSERPSSAPLRSFLYPFRLSQVSHYPKDRATVVEPMSERGVPGLSFNHRYKEGPAMNGIRKTSVLLALALFASLGGCVPDPYSQENGHTTNTQPVSYAPPPVNYAPTPVNYAPTAPPAPLVEAVPSAPGPTVYWQPGNWTWTGTQWA